MFINELLNTYNAENVEHLVNVECFKLQHKIYEAYDKRDTKKLLAYAQNILRVSKRDARCAMLANLSVTAQQLANRIASDNDTVASAVISKGSKSMESAVAFVKWQSVVVSTTLSFAVFRKEWEAVSSMNLLAREHLPTQQNTMCSTMLVTL